MDTGKKGRKEGREGRREGRREGGRREGRKEGRRESKGGRERERKSHLHIWEQNISKDNFKHHNFHWHEKKYANTMKILGN